MDNTHVKPTSEQLDEAIKKSQEDLEIIEETPNEQKVEEKPTVEENEEESTDTTEEAEGDDTIKKETEETPEDKEQIDYKKRYVESTREAQILFNKTQKYDEAIQRASELPEPTDEELQKEYTDWENLSEFEKKIARQNLINSRKLDYISRVNQEFKDIDAWNKKVDGFIDDPKTLSANPDLEGKAEDFKLFATKSTRRGVDFETLVASFLWESEKNKVRHTGKMMETGTGGANEKAKPKSDKISTQEAVTLRKTNYNKYVQLLKQGKIDDSAL